MNIRAEQPSYSAIRQEHSSNLQRFSWFNRNNGNQAICVPSVIELPLAIIYAIATIPFLKKDTFWMRNPFFINTLACAVNILIRYLTSEKFRTESRANQIILSLINYILPVFIFSLIDLTTRGILMHETAHVVALMSYTIIATHVLL